MSSYACALRIAPRETNELRGISKHNCRTKEEAEELSRDPRYNINPSLTHHNVIIFGTNDQYSDVQKVSDGYNLIRKDSKTTSFELVITHDKQYFKENFGNDFTEKETKKKIVAWANDSVDVLKDIFKEQDKGIIASAILHLDEDTPHLHVVAVPIVECTRQKKSIGKHINYSLPWSDKKDVISKARKEKRSDVDTKLGRFQTDFANNIKKKAMM